MLPHKDKSRPYTGFNKQEKIRNKEFYEFGKLLGRGKGEIDNALIVAEESQKSFYQRMQERGREALNQLSVNSEQSAVKDKKEDKIAVVIVGRPYNTMDNGINLELPQKLRDMGVLAIPFDMLPVDDAIDDTLAADMYWKSGQRILATARLINDNPNLYAIYLTNFGCGPDSFITHFFKDRAKDKPFLQLEIDEHSADAGAITRCEAFLDSLRNIRKRGQGSGVMGRVGYAHQQTPVHRTGLKKKIYLPYMADAVYAMKAAFEACGIEAEIIPEPDDETLKWGRRYSSG